MSSSETRKVRRALNNVQKGLKSRVSLDLSFATLNIAKGSARTTHEEFVEFSFIDPNGQLHQLLVPGSDLVDKSSAVSYTHLTLPTIYSV